MINKKMLVPIVSGLIFGFVAATVAFGNISPGQQQQKTAAANGGTTVGSGNTDAEKVYVPLGKKDEYYLFASGGHSGQLFVYGVPSMREIRTVPIFSPDPATGYGFDSETKKMLGGLQMGDFHHPALSETNGDYNGKYLFATDVENSRAAVVDLKTFTTKDIIKVPNTSGPHCAAFVTQNTEYVFLPTRFAVPIGQQYTSLDEYSQKYRGVMSALTLDQQNEKLNIAYQVALPPWSYDLSDAGKKGSGDWAVMTTYNTEEATSTLEINASKADRDYVVLFNWKELAQMVKDGKYEEVNGQKMIFPEKEKGGIYLIPTAKSPHGVDVTPDGKYFIASGKLAPAMTVFSFEKAFEAIKNKEFAGERNGIPVLQYKKVLVKEVNPDNALGPLHTTFDDKGNAYTSMFISSEVVKWKYATGQVLDRIPVQYSPGHVTAAEGDTVSPDGKYLVSLNKLAKDNFLSVGPSHPETMQLIDISGQKMHLLDTVPANPEPHYAQMIKADKIHPINVYPKDPNNKDAVYKQDDTKIVRTGNRVDVYGTAMRSRFTFDHTQKRPDEIDVNQGDHVYIHLTNIDFDEDITHGFAINGYDINMEVQPGQTNTLDFVADKAGTFPLYCTNFCSALHQEMTGYFQVKPKQ
jgi:nitrous-oxide reductase